MSPNNRLATTIVGATMALGIGLASSYAHAVTISAEDVSRKIISCDSNNPFLRSLPSGFCLAAPDKTLYVTATLDEGEDPAVLDEMDVVVQVGEHFYHYDGSGNLRNDTELWRPFLITAESDGMPVPSFRRMAGIETKSITRQVNYSAFVKEKGASFYVGSRKNRNEPYTERMINKVFVIH